MRLGRNADIVQVRGNQDALDLGLAQSNPLTHLLTHTRDAHRVRTAIGIELLHQSDEHAKRLEVNLRVDRKIASLLGRRQLLDERVACRNPRLRVRRRLVDLVLDQLIVGGLLTFE